jgi:hypothetical protein
VREEAGPDSAGLTGYGRRLALAPQLSPAMVAETHHSRGTSHEGGNSLHGAVWSGRRGSGVIGGGNPAAEARLTPGWKSADQLLGW